LQQSELKSDDGPSRNDGFIHTALDPAPMIRKRLPCQFRNVYPSSTLKLVDSAEPTL